MPDAFIQVDGLRELILAARALDPAVEKGVKDAIKDAVRIVAVEIDRRAPRGPSGKLRKSIKPSVRGFSGSIIVSARKRSPRYPSGYPYPTRIEYQGGGSGAFVRPAVVAKAEQVARMFEAKVHDEVERVWGR